MVKLYNTLSRKKEIFRPIRKDRVGLYTCGPTVYNFVHIGNLRTYVFQDILKRTLEYAGYGVKHVMNTTDVDDKTIKGSQEAGKPLKEFTRFYERVFLEDLKKLNINLPSVLTRATEYIPEMIKLVQKLLKKKIAYQKEGSVYFDISRFKSYGKLARLDKKGMRAGVRVDADEYAKDQVEDFVLWKGKKPDEPSWKTPFGEGRPGWHIECSAMSMKHLGQTFDLHTGGVDLIFPHHQNEIAQSEATTGKKFVRYWVHGEHLLVEGKRMAKSLRNFFTLRDIETKNFNPLGYRYLVLTSHYRSRLNFTWESMQAAENSLERLYEFVRELKVESVPNLVRNRVFRTKFGTFEKNFTKAIFDDLDTPKALAIIWKIIRDYRKNPEKFDSKNVLEILFRFDEILGLKLKNVKKEAVPQEIAALVKKREELRESKRWKEADELRASILKKGFIVEDASQGPIVKSS